MHCKLHSRVVITIMLVTYINSQGYKHRFKRANMDNFNVLLGLYKLSPLMKSNFYKSFSHQAMLPNKARPQNVVLNFVSNESTKEKQEKTNLHLKEIEQQIHGTNSSRKSYEQPDYDIENINAEKFIVDVIVNDRINNNELRRNEEVNGFDDILGHLESGEINEKLAVTKNVSARNDQELLEEISSRHINNEINLNNGQIKNNITAGGNVKRQSNNTFNENKERNPAKYLASNYVNDEVVIFK